jgi:predicted ATPase/DNA-binding winged helix-turn-helix (wHTH) protein
MNNHVERGTAGIARFGPFRLTAAERLLQRGDEIIPVGSRALDILIVLVERAGEVVPHRELIERVWPDLVVEEANLRVHLSTLRKHLQDGKDGQRYIANVAGRGYSFVAPVQYESEPEPARAAAPVEQERVDGHRLPPRLARMIGRDETVDTISRLVRNCRFVTIVAPGGMGKTTVAISVAHALLDDVGGAAHFVDLASVHDRGLVAATIASAIGHRNQVGDPVAGILTFLNGQRRLILLDNCEHVIDAVAQIAERIHGSVPEVLLLATSREALRVEGETVHFLSALEVPSDSEVLSAAEALASPAVQLFVERAAAGGHVGELMDAEAPLVARVCRRLDGIALGIELAASRVGVYGIQGIADSLDDRFKFLLQGKRSALPRHQTLHAMLDWSYGLLSDRDRAILCRLSVLVGAFTSEAAQSVAAEPGVEAVEVQEALMSLVDKSLVSVVLAQSGVMYRLLDTTRAYARARLAERRETDIVARRHALYSRDRLSFGYERAVQHSVQAAMAFADDVPNIRSALEWCFSCVGDHALGVELAVRAAPIFVGLSLLGECQRWCERALAALADSDRGTRYELVLRAALATSVMFTSGNDDSVRAEIDRGLELAERLGEASHTFNLLAGLHIFLVRIGALRESVGVAKRSATIAAEMEDPSGIVMADWMLGTTYHLIGDQRAAQHHHETGLRRAEEWGCSEIDFFGYDHKNRSLIGLARTLWLRGFPDRAAQVARQAMTEAEARKHPVGLCIAMIYTTTVLLWRGDLREAEERIERIIDHAARHSLAPYHAVGMAFKGELVLSQGSVAKGVSLLRSALTAMRVERHFVLETAFSRAFAEGLLASGETAEAAMILDGALARAEARGGACDLPDILRLKAEVLLASSTGDYGEAEHFLRKALELSRAQSAHSLELRAAMTLLPLRERQGRTEEGRKVLAEVLARFIEGYDTADVEKASRCLRSTRSQLSIVRRQ